MTLAQLRRLVAKWQIRLKLIDWDISVRWAHLVDDADDIARNYAWASTLTHIRRAELVFVHPDNHKDVVKKNIDRETDIEVVIVHELRHLGWAPMQTEEGSPAEVVEENDVDMTSRLLVALDRGEEHLVGRKLPSVASIKSKKKGVPTVPVIEEQTDSQPEAEAD